MPQQPQNPFLPVDPKRQRGPFEPTEQEIAAFKRLGAAQGAVQTTPEEAAAGFTRQGPGLPATLESARDQRLKQLDADLAKAHPKVQSFFSSNPAHLSAAQDDIGVLSKLGDILGQIEDIPDSWLSKFWQDPSGQTAEILGRINGPGEADRRDNAPERGRIGRALRDAFIQADKSMSYLYNDPSGAIADALGPAARIGEELPYTAGAASAGLGASAQSVAAGLLKRLPFRLPNMSGLNADMVERQSQGAQDVHDALVGDQTGLSSTERSILGGVESTLMNAIPLGVAQVAGAPALLTTAIGGIISGGQARASAIKGGAPEGTATAHGLANGVIEAATEFLPISYLGDYLGGKTGFAQFLKKEAVSELFGEQAATFFQDLEEQITLNPDKPISDFLKERPDAAYQTFISTLTTMAIHGVALGGIGDVQTTPKKEGEKAPSVSVAPSEEQPQGTSQLDRMAQRVAAQKAQDVANATGQDALTQIEEIVKKSATRKRAPEVLRQLASAITGKEVHISASDLTEVLQAHGKTVADVIENVPSLSGQYDVSSILGGDVTIPLSEWVAGIAGEDFAPDLIQRTRLFETVLGEGGEADTAGAKQAFEQAQAEQQRHDERDQFHQRIAGELQAARPDLYADKKKAEDSTLPLAIMADTLAKRLGMSLSESGLNQYRIVGDNITESNQVPGAIRRGSFDLRENLFRLGPEANLNTFLHETGHAFLAAYDTLAAQLIGTEQHKGVAEFLAQERKILNTWLGPRSTNAQWAEAHEKFANSFQNYLFTGEAPGGLKGVFQQFKAWLTEWYQRITSERVPNLGINDVQIPPEVKLVMDRMLGADLAVQGAQNELNDTPLFNTRENAKGLTDTEWEEYTSLQQTRTEQAIEEMTKRSLSAVRWLRNQFNTGDAKMRRAVEKQRREIHELATDEVRQRRERVAERFFTDGKLTVDGKEQTVETPWLDKAEVDKLYAGVENVPDFENLKFNSKPLVAEGGVDPQFAATALGYETPQQLINAMSDLQPMWKDVDALTDQMMIEEHGGDIFRPGAIEGAVNQSVHNDARIKMAALELKALKQSVNVTEISKVARRLAKDSIERTKAGSLKVRNFDLAEARSARLSQEALTKGDVALAAEHKRNQILNMLAGKRAAQVLEEMKSDLRYVKKFRKASLTEAIGRDTVEQVVGLLEQFGFREPTSTSRPPLQEWIDEQPNGLGPDVAPWILGAGQKSWDQLTVAEFNDVIDAIKSIEKTGRNRQEMLTTGRAIKISEAAKEGAQEIRGNAGASTDQPVTKPKTGVISGLLHDLGLFDFDMRRFDGNKDNGFWYNLLVKGKNMAADKKVAMQTRAFKDLNGLFEALAEKVGPLGQKTDVPHVGALTRSERLMVALYAGTRESYQRLEDGGIYGLNNSAGEAHRLDQGQIQSVLDTLSENEVNFVQGVWKYLEGFRSELEAKEKRLKGYAPKWVEGIPVKMGEKVVQGGYFPIRYDTRVAPASASRTADPMQQVFNGEFAMEGTRHKFLKDRQNFVKGRPLALDLATLSNHTNSVIQDIAFHEWVVDASRILQHQAVKDAIVEKHGEPLHKRLMDDVNAFALGDLGHQSYIDRAVRHLEKASAVSTLAFNMNVAALQLGGLSQAAPRIGAPGLAAGMQQFMADISAGKNPLQAARDESEFMRHRDQTMMRAFTEFQQKLRGDNKLVNAFSKATNKVVNDWGFFMVRQMQGVADTIIYNGAKAKGMSELGMKEEDAIQYANNTVRDTQGSGLLTDRAAVERSGMGKLLTMYWSYFGRTYNLTREVVDKTKGMKDVPKAARDLAALYAAPAVFATVLFALMRSKEPEKDVTVSKVLQAMGGHALNMIPVAREAAGITQGFDYNGPPAFRAFAQGAKLMKDATDFYKGDRYGDHEFKEKYWRDLNATAGPALGYPSSQVDRSLRGLIDYLDTSRNPEQILFGPRLEPR